MQKKSNKHKLTHLNKKGMPSLVDISDKAISERTAIARGEIYLSQEALEHIKGDKISKGNVFSTAMLAGIMAAKQTSHTIPLCHNIPIESVNIDFKYFEKGIEVEAKVKTSSKTGAEMEALNAISSSCLTIYDMVKSIDKSMRINNIRLIYKEGGKSGVYHND